MSSLDQDVKTGSRRGKDAGYLVVLAAVMMTALFGFLALGTDLGYLYQRKRIMQNAADAGAVYGAQAIKRGNTTLVEDTAWDGTAANGFTNDVDGVVVTVNNPPLSGSYVTEAKAVEVIICQDQLTFFMQVLNVFSAPVCARGVAGYTGNGQGCIYALDESADQAFHVHDSVLDLNCGIVVNSTSSSAMYAESGSDITATSIGVTGDYLYEDATSDPYPPETGVPPSSDPLAYLEEPDTSGISCDYTNYNLNSAGMDTLNPGVYCGGIHIESASTAHMNPGFYIMMGGGFNLESNSTLTGYGITVYLTYGAAWPYSGLWLHDSSYDLSAPTEGDYAGILFWQDPTAPTCVWVGGDNTGICGAPLDLGGGTENFIESCESCALNTLEGVLYFSTQNLRIHATPTMLSGGGAAYTVIVADTIWIESDSMVGTLPIPADYSSLVEGSPIKRVVLLE